MALRELLEPPLLPDSRVLSELRVLPELPEPLEPPELPELPKPSELPDLLVAVVVPMP